MLCERRSEFGGVRAKRPQTGNFHCREGVSRVFWRALSSSSCPFVSWLIYGLWLAKDKFTGTKDNIVDYCPGWNFAAPGADLR